MAEGINRSEISLKEAEERILEHVNRLGQIMVDEVVERILEPVYENRVVVEGKNAVRKMKDTQKGWGVINCFKNNIKRIDYGEYRNRGFPIGSGIVEGTATSLSLANVSKAAG